ncbi:MAG: hypothetical protein WC209_11890 [Ignavibacteriaceae bacterium]|jgi:hypothetical protein
MKKLATIPLLLVLFFFGCQKQESVVSPDQNSTNSMSKPVWVLAAEKQGLTFISLPQSNSISLQKRYDSEFIKSGESGKLSVEKTYRTLGNHRVSVEASLSVLENSLDQNSLLTMAISDDFLSFEFGPSGTTFSKSALLNVKVEGLDFSASSELQTAHLKYFDEVNNVWVDVDADNIIVNVEEGIFICKNGKINHFSRYGFTN